MFKFFICIALCQISTAYVIETHQGLVRGFPQRSYNNVTYYAFEGIPYAKPPLENLRFQNPVPGESWEGILDANNTYTCPQVTPVSVFNGNSVMGQEDCLYINVYVPEGNLTGLEVIVHIHGGGFVLGSPRMMAGPRYIMNHPVIYVSFNYRLGILGFLSFGDENAAGNFGLKDQVLALKWIRKNVERFGGNPDSITLTGMSAGGASVHYHLLSKQSAGLFNRAWSWSGTALCPWALWRTPKENALELSRLWGCPLASTRESVECLRKVNAKDLAASLLNFTHFGNVAPIAPFGPVVEHSHAEAFLEELPKDILQRGELSNDVPMVFATVDDEGIFPVGYYAMMQKFSEMNDRWQEVMPYALEYGAEPPEGLRPDGLKAIRQYYFQDNEVSKKTLKNLIQLFTDRFFHYPIQKTFNIHREISKSPVYVYLFSYDSPAFYAFPTIHGVSHVEDGQLVFNLLVTPLELVPKDVQMMEYMTRLLVNYAKNSVGDEKWEPLSNNSRDPIGLWHIRGPGDFRMETVDEIAPTEFWDRWSF